MGWGEKLNKNSCWYKKHHPEIAIKTIPVVVSPIVNLGKKKSLWQIIIDFFRGR